MSKISDQQTQELSNAIADICEQMQLEPEQILDGLARTLMSAAATFEAKSVNVSIEGYGQCQVSLQSLQETE